MIRQDIIAAAQVDLNEVQGKPGFDSPFGWNRLVDKVTDEIARMDTFYTTFAADLVAGQAGYCAPEIYRIAAVLVTWDDGTVYTAEPVTPLLMDQRYSYWRTDATTGTPFLAVMQGLGSFQLYPTPVVSVSGGISIEGYAVPSVAAPWPNPTDGCPLPLRYHEMVVTGVAYYRCQQFPTEENMMRYPMLKDSWLMQKGEIGREIEDQSEATRFGDAPDTALGSFLGGWGF